MARHIVKILKPYGIGPYVAVAIESKKSAKWFLYNLSGTLIKHGYSKCTREYNVMCHAMDNCASAARRLARKEAPVLFNKLPEFEVSTPSGRQSNMFGGQI